MLLYLALGALAFWLVLRTSAKTRLPRREWRFLTAAAAMVAFAGAAYAGLRSEWLPVIVLVMMGSWLTLSTRRPPTAAPPPARGASEGMSLAEARAILGVSADATAEEVKAAYTRLMRSVHPDKGGTAGLARQLNAARDRLLKP